MGWLCCCRRRSSSGFAMPGCPFPSHPGSRTLSGCERRRGEEKADEREREVMTESKTPTTFPRCPSCSFQQLQWFKKNNMLAKLSKEIPDMRQWSAGGTDGSERGEKENRRGVLCFLWRRNFSIWDQIHFHYLDASRWLINEMCFQWVLRGVCLIRARKDSNLWIT